MNLKIPADAAVNHGDQQTAQPLRGVPAHAAVNLTVKGPTKQHGRHNRIVENYVARHGSEEEHNIMNMIPNVLFQLTEDGQRADGRWRNPNPQWGPPAKYLREMEAYTATAFQDDEGNFHLTFVDHQNLTVQTKTGREAQVAYQTIQEGVRRFGDEQLELADLMSEINEDILRDHRSPRYAEILERDHAEALNHQVWLATYNGIMKWSSEKAGEVCFDRAGLAGATFTIVHQPGARTTLTIQKNDKTLARTSEGPYGRGVVQSITTEILNRRIAGTQATDGAQ